MNNFFKKYWSHILNISFLIYLTVFFAIIGEGVKNESSAPPPAFFPLFLLIEILMVVGILFEIIYYMIKAAQCDDLKNKGLCMVGIYMLNVFYIPCFALKHIHKDSKAKVKNIIYVITSIVLFIAFYILVIKFVMLAD